MTSKQVLDREKSTRTVVASAEAHASEIATAIKQQLSPYLRKGESLPDAALLAHLMSHKLTADLDTLVRADRAHEAELSDDTAPREARDTAAENVRSALVDVRDAVNTAFGLAGLTKLGLTDSIPVDPTAVAGRADSVVTALRNEKIKLPASRRASLKLDRSGFADEIAADLPALLKALKDVAREEREAKGTQSAKNDAMEAHDRGFAHGAGLLSQLAGYGGLDAIAATVRPSARRAGRTAAEDLPPEPKIPLE